MVCGDNRPCSPHVDEGLESLLPCNILFEEDCYEYKEDMDRKEHDAMDEESPTYDMDGSDDYWNFIQVMKILLRIPSTICPATGVPIQKKLEVQSMTHP